MVLALTEVVCLIVLPWTVGWIAMLRNPGFVYLNGLLMPPGWLAIVDLLGIFAAYAYFSLYSASVPGSPTEYRVTPSSTVSGSALRCSRILSSF